MIFVNEDRESKWRLGTVFVCADSACEKQINVVEHDDKLEKMVGSKKKKLRNWRSEMERNGLWLKVPTCAYYKKYILLVLKKVINSSHWPTCT